MSLNLVVPKVINLRIEWFHIINSHKSSGSIEPLSKIKWFHGTTGTTNNAGPGISQGILFFALALHTITIQGWRKAWNIGVADSNKSLKYWYGSVADSS